MDNELNSGNLASELELCLMRPKMNTLIVLPDVESRYSFINAFEDAVESDDFKVTPAGITFKNGSCIRIWTKDMVNDAYIENRGCNCVLFEHSLIDIEPDIADLDNFLKTFFVNKT